MTGSRSAAAEGEPASPGTGEAESAHCAQPGEGSGAALYVRDPRPHGSRRAELSRPGGGQNHRQRDDRGPRLLVTGFGPFPGAPENPTETLVRRLAVQLPSDFGASALRALVLPTDYRRSWTALRRIYASFAPDVVVHFGLSSKAEAITIERLGCRRVSADRSDSAGFAPRSGFARGSGPDALESSLPVDALLQALRTAGFPAAVSEDAGGYVCNATLYRSLLASPKDARRLVGFIHVPPAGTNDYTTERLQAAASVILRVSAAVWGPASRQAQDSAVLRSDGR